jgi:hypothetical protein
MNLWARRSALTFMLALLLIFIGCEDPLSNLGFRNPNQKFVVRFVEIDVPSSVLLMDSVPTLHNLANPGDDIYRLMVGAYSNPVFGNTTASTITQFRPSQVGSTISEAAILDSLVLKMRLDFYTTGSLSRGPIKINVFEVDEEIIPSNIFFNNTEIAISNTPIGQIDFFVQPDIYEAFLEAGRDTTIHLKAHLSNDLGARLFAAAKAADSTFNQYQYFRKRFKGLALVPEQAEHVVGLRINNPDSRIEMHYHDEADTSKIDFYFDSLIGYTKLNSDRGGTALSGVNNFYTEYMPADGRLYVQGGTGLVTKIDFNKFLEFTDTIPDIVLNSAELVILNAEAPQGIRFPQELKIKALRNTNRFRSIINKQDSIALSAYRLTYGAPNQYDRVWYDLDFSFLIGGDTFSGAVMSLKSNNSYQTFITLFLQRLLEVKNPDKLFNTAAIYVSKPVFGKSLDGFTFDKGDIKLRIYYTKATNL